MRTSDLLSLLACSALMGCGDKDPVDTSLAGDDTAVTYDDTDSEEPGVGNDDTGAALECEAPVALPALSGDAWTPAGTPPGGDVWILAGAPSDVERIYAGSSTNGLYTSADGGRSWTKTAAPANHVASQLAIHPADPETIVYASGTVWRSQDAGESWTALPLGALLDSTEAIHGLLWVEEALFAVDGDGWLYRSDDLGSSFEQLALVDPRRHAAIGEFDEDYWQLAESDGSLYVLRDGGDIFRSDDGGLSWDVMVDGEHVFGTLNARGDEVWAGELEALNYSADRAGSWDKLASPYQINGLTVSDESDLITLSSAYGLWTYTDAEGLDGYYIAEADTPTASWLLPGDHFLVSHLEGLLRSEDGAESWTDVGGALVDLELAALAVDPLCGNRLWAGTADGRGVYVSEDWGQTWSHVQDSGSYVGRIATDPHDRNTLWMTADDEIFVSEDLGSDWNIVSEDDDRAHFHGIAVDPSAAGRGLVGSSVGGLYGDASPRILLTEDRGESWRDASGGLPSGSISVHALLFIDGDVALAGTWRGGHITHEGEGSGGGLYRSTDGGESWSEASLEADGVPDLALCGGRVWAATDAGVFASTDGGESWTRSLEGAALSVACMDDLALAWLPEGGLYRTDDAGESWSAWGDGLPGLDAADAMSGLAIAAGGEVAYVALRGEGAFLRPL